MNQSVRYLMCRPDFYDVNYVINPWMEGNIHAASRRQAVQQWTTLLDVLSDHAPVDLLEPQPGWPDLVFTANAGLVAGRTALVSRFLHPERQGEEPFFSQWFKENGFAVHHMPKEISFEGAGDALLDREGPFLWAGHGFRSQLQAHSLLAKWFDYEVVSLRLTDPRFYHLDTCFCPLAGGYLMYHPAAFDEASLKQIERRVPAARRIIVNDEDSLTFACNAINVDHNVILNHISHDLRTRLTAAGFRVVETPLTQFIKAGGAAKCLTLRTTEPAQARRGAHVA